MYRFAEEVRFISSDRIDHMYKLFLHPVGGHHIVAITIERRHPELCETALETAFNHHLFRRREINPTFVVDERADTLELRRSKPDR